MVSKLDSILVDLDCTMAVVIMLYLRGEKLNRHQGQG